MRQTIPAAVTALLAAFMISPAASMAATLKSADVRAIVSQAVLPVMKEYAIPGMAIGVTVNARHYLFNYGVASKATGKPIQPSTLFEIGSITKTFTASLVSYAQLTGKLSLSDETSADFSPLRGTHFDNIRLVNLGTHTAGGLPLQFPQDVQTDNDAIAYYRHWKPTHPAGMYRLYSNPSIMLLGLIAAQRMNETFAAAMQRELFAPLGLHDTYLDVPADQISRYAQGYTDAGTPRRMAPGPLAAEAYGIRTTAGDMLRFIDANMNQVDMNGTLRRAIINTHTGYFRIGAMTQDLIWEQLRNPVTLSGLLRSNSNQVMLAENAVAPVEPPSPPESDVTINKTGSTSGFGAYVAFVPLRNTGIVVLANKAYPVAARVATAYRIMARLNAKMTKP